MKTFLEVENKMGTTIQTSMPNSQIRPPLPITNPNVCRSDNAERRKTIMPKRKFRPVFAANPPIPQAPPKPNYEIPPTAVRADTPWPGAGRNVSWQPQLMIEIGQSRKGYLAADTKQEK